LKPVLVTLLSAEVAPAAAVGDVAELLDVDVDEFAWSLALVAAGWLTGDPVDVAESVQATPGQHCMDSRGRHVEFRSDRNRPKSLLPPQVHDPTHHRLWGLGVLGVSCRDPVSHSGRSFVAVTLGPLGCRAPRDVEELSRS
jgi:hypothetical protein